MSLEEFRKIEEEGLKIGRTINERINRNNPGVKKYGFLLMVFTFDGNELTYLSNAERDGMLTLLEEFVKRQRSGIVDGTSESWS